MTPKKPKDKRCKECKQLFTPFKTTQSVCSVLCASKQAKLKVDKEKEENKKTEDKKWKEVKKVVHTKKYKKYLQDEVNKLARMIDLKFGYNTCIDCGGSFGEQQDGGHFKSRGSNCSLRYNLDNIHSQASNCNRNGMGGGKTLDYYRGLIKRYGQSYADYIDSELQLKYPVIKLSEKEVYEKLTLVRSLVRNFNTFELTGSQQARTLFNNIIGIYNE